MGNTEIKKEGKTMEKLRINIKGVDYTLKTQRDLIILGDSICDGVCDKVNKEIILSCQTEPDRKDHVFRHEIIHAFLFESGLLNYSSNEVLVDWLAFHIPQIEKVFNNTKQKMIDNYNAKLNKHVKPQEENNVKNSKRKRT